MSDVCSPASFLSDPGDPIHVIYSPVIKDGQITLVESGRQSIPQAINSFASTCDMQYILSRLSAGDASVLAQRDAFFADVSDLSYNRADMLQHVNDCRVYFDNLPDDVRAKFDDNFIVWLSSAGAPEWAEKMTSPLADRSNPVTKEGEPVES